MTPWGFTYFSHLKGEPMSPALLMMILDRMDRVNTPKYLTTLTGQVTDFQEVAQTDSQPQVSQSVLRQTDNPKDIEVFEEATQNKEPMQEAEHKTIQRRI
jgi:hypothetical protein